MGKVIDIRLSTASINNAINELRIYRQELIRKSDLLVQRLAEVGLEVVNANKFGRGDSDFGGLNSYVWMDYGGTRVTAHLVMTGKDVAFIEFGAGVHYNGSGGSSPHPYGSSLGMIIGSYGKGYGLQDRWFYKGDGGKWQESHGTEAAMPMYKASQEIRDRFIGIAKEVFNA